MSTINPQTEFTYEEIAAQSMLNAQAMALGLIVHGREHGQSADQVARWIGAIFAPGWEQTKGQGALPAARLAAKNMVSVGSRLIELEGDEREAYLTLSGWIGDGALDYFGVSREEADAFFAVFEPIAGHLGLDYRWQRDGDTVAMTITRREG